MATLEEMFGQRQMLKLAIRIATIGYWLIVLLSLLFITSILFGFQPPTAAPIEFTASGNTYSFVCPVGSLH